MAWRMVQQPNGKFARFSEVVDDFTHYDLNADEAVTLCRRYMGELEAEEKVANALKEPDRYQESLSIIATIHGPETRAEREKQLGAPDDPILS